LIKNKSKYSVQYMCTLIMLSNGCRRRTISDGWSINPTQTQPQKEGVGTLWTSSVDGSLHYTDTLGVDYDISGGIGGGPTPVVSLQDAYDNGRFIDVAPAAPVAFATTPAAGSAAEVIVVQDENLIQRLRINGTGELAANGPIISTTSMDCNSMDVATGLTFKPSTVPTPAATTGVLYNKTGDDDIWWKQPSGSEVNLSAPTTPPTTAIEYGYVLRDDTTFVVSGALVGNGSPHGLIHETNPPSTDSVLSGGMLFGTDGDGTNGIALVPSLTGDYRIKLTISIRPTNTIVIGSGFYYGVKTPTRTWTTSQEKEMLNTEGTVLTFDTVLQVGATEPCWPFIVTGFPGAGALNVSGYFFSMEYIRYNV
jgi:hypothetical protein